MAKKKDWQGSRIPDSKRIKIAAHYAESNNYSETGRAFGISGNTVKNIVDEYPVFSEVLEHKKEEQMKSILEHMDSKTPEVITFIDRYMREFMNEEKIDKLPLNQLSTVFGTVIDKFTMKDRLRLEQEVEDKHRLNELQAIFGGKNDPK